MEGTMQKTVSAPKTKRTAPTTAPARRPTHPPPPAIYALTAWAVKKVKGKWYVAPTGARFDEKTQWSKPYATLQRATTAIARKLADEVIKRHKRRCDFYGIND
jgi:hypothetical protein